MGERFIMCMSERCPHRGGCRRNEASGTAPSHRQLWADFHDERRGEFWCRANEMAALSHQEAQGGGNG